MGTAIHIAELASSATALRLDASATASSSSPVTRLPTVTSHIGLRKAGLVTLSDSSRRTWADVKLQVGSMSLTVAVAELIPMVKVEKPIQADALSCNGNWRSIMQDLQSLPSTVSMAADEGLNIYLSIYNRLLRLGRLTECLSVLEDMKAGGILDMNKIFQNRFFQECRSRKAVKEAYRFVDLMPKQTVALYTQLISVCTAAADVEGARRAFRSAQSAGFEVDCALYTALISACCKAGELESAFKVFHEMEAAGVEPNLKTYSALINGCAKAKHVAKAFGVYGIMITKNLKPDRVIFHTLIAACGNTESLDRAFDVLQDMKEAKIAPDHQTMAIIIDACTMCKQVDRALGIYRVLRDKGTATTAATYTAAIDACSITGSLPTAFQIYRDMKKAGVKPDELVYCTLIKVALKARDVDKGFAMLDEMKRHRVVPTTKTYNHLLSLCREFHLPERALELYSEMTVPTRKPDVVTFNTLMQILCNAKNLERALDLLDDMSKAGVVLNHRTYMILLRGCADRSVNNVDVAFKLYHTADLEGKNINLANCDAIIDLCYEQIRTGAKPPTFSFTAGRFPVDATMRSPRQQWAASALAIYKQTVAAGVVPTRPLLSKMLGCLRKPDERDEAASQETSFAEDALFMSRASGRVPFGLLEGAPRASNLEDIYEPHAIPLYEDAAELGIVPEMSITRPSFIDVAGLPTHAAEVCILAYLTTLRFSKRPIVDGKQTKLSPLTIKMPAHESTTAMNGGRGQKKVRVANRAAQAIAALLRRLGVPYIGYESSGKLHITASGLEKWLSMQPSLPQSQHAQRQSRSRQRDSGLRGARLAQNLLEQQRAIRMGATPVFSPGGFYKPYGTWEGQLHRPSVLQPVDDEKEEQTDFSFSSLETHQLH